MACSPFLDMMRSNAAHHVINKFSRRFLDVEKKRNEAGRHCQDIAANF